MSRANLYPSKRSCAAFDHTFSQTHFRDTVIIVTFANAKINPRTLVNYNNQAADTLIHWQQ